VRRARLVVIAVIAAFATLGVPSHVSAAPSVPAALDRVLRIPGQVDPGSHVRRTVGLPWRANLLSVSFVSADPSAEGVEVVIRAHVAGAWSAPVDIDVEPDEAADAAEQAGATRRVVTAPAWVGAADAVEVHVAVEPGAAPVGDIRLHLTNTNGDAYAPTFFSRARAMFGVAGRFLAATAVNPAAAAPTKPSIISRKGWGADESLRDGDGPGLADAAKIVFVHHTANDNSYSKSQSAALVRGIYRYHTMTRGYSDIAYNFLVDRYGQIFEGRAGGIDKPVIGAHTKGFNTGSIGVSMIGTFGSVSPTSAMMGAMKRLIAWKMDVHHLPPIGTVTLVSGGSSKYDEGTKVTFNRIAAHRNANDTACPGSIGYSKMKWLRDAVNATGRPKIYLPVASSALLRPDGNTTYETVKVTAGLSQTASWTVTFLDAAGHTLRTFSKTSSSVSATWDGLRSDGTRVNTGRATWRIAAKDASGHAATPATGVLYIVTNYPAGSLITDAQGAFLATRVASPLTTLTRKARFGSMPAVVAGPRVRSSLTPGTPLGVRDGALLQGPDGTRYIYSAGTLRRFAYDPQASPPVDAFASLGYQPTAAIVVDDAVIASLPQGAPVQDVAIHPDGTVVRDAATGSMWVVAAGTRRPISALARASWYRASEVVAIADGDAQLPVGTTFPPRIGTLLKATDGGAPWVISGNTAKRRFRDSVLFSRMGFTSSMLVTASQADLDALSTSTIYG
jgi:hypothetical protein